MKSSNATAMKVLSLWYRSHSIDSGRVMIVLGPVSLILNIIFNLEKKKENEMKEKYLTKNNSIKIYSPSLGLKSQNFIKQSLPAVITV